MEKYGVPNISQSEIIKQKKRETFIEHYGVDNIWKSKEYYETLHLLMLEKYGSKSVPNLHGNANPFGWKNLSKEKKEVRENKRIKGFFKWWESLTDEQKTEVIQKRTKKLVVSYNSSLESKIMMGLNNLTLKFKHQFWVDRKSFDFFLWGTKILIEVNGNFWHANPLIYKANDMLRFGKIEINAESIWKKDEEKRLIAEKYGYTVLYIWESEIKGKTQPEIMKLISDKIYENKINKKNKE